MSSDECRDLPHGRPRIGEHIRGDLEIVHLIPPYLQFDRHSGLGEPSSREFGVRAQDLVTAHLKKCWR